MQFRVTIKAQTSNYESIKIANQKISEVKGAGFFLMECCEVFRPGQKTHSSGHLASADCHT